MHNVNTPFSRHIPSTSQLTEAEAKVNTRESRHISSGKQSGRQCGMNAQKTCTHYNKKTETVTVTVTETETVTVTKEHKEQKRELSSRRPSKIKTQIRKITDELFRKKNTNSQYLHCSNPLISRSKTVKTKEQTPEISSNHLCDTLMTSSSPLPFSSNRPLPALPTKQAAISSEISAPMPEYRRYQSIPHLYEEISTIKPSWQKRDACSQTVNTGINTHDKTHKNRSYRHRARHNSDFVKRVDLPEKNRGYCSPEFCRSSPLQIPDQKIKHVPVRRKHENPSFHPLSQPTPLCDSNSSQYHQDFVSLSNQISTNSKRKDHYTPPLNRQYVRTKNKHDYRTSSSKLRKSHQLSSNKNKHNPTNKVSLDTQKVNSLHERNNHFLASLKLQDKHQYNASKTMDDISESADFDKSDIPVNGVNDSINSPKHPQPTYYTLNPADSDTESPESELISLSNQISTKSKRKDHYTPPVNRQDIRTKTKRDYRTSSSKLRKNHHLSSNENKHKPTNKVSLETQKVNSLHERNNHFLASLKLPDKHQYNASKTMADISESADFDKSDIPVNGVNDSINSPKHPQPTYYTLNTDTSDTESAESEVNKYIDYGLV